MFETLPHQYKTELGHINVPQIAVGTSKLGIWVSTQRQKYEQTTTKLEAGSW